MQAGEVLQLAIDEQGYTVRFFGWHQALEVLEPPGRLAPWSLGAHVEALSRCQGSAGLEVEAFSDAVLSTCWTGTGRAPRALALWWATGAEHKGGLDLDLGHARVTLQSCSFATRIQALEAAGALTPAPHLDVGRWLWAKVEGSILRIEPEGYPVQALPAAPLLAGLDALETPADGIDVARLPKPLRDTLRRVCRALGWTPSQVLAAPSSEIDRVLALLEDEYTDDLGADRPPTGKALAPRARPLQGLAAMPDAIVIQYHDDADEVEEKV